MATFACVGSFDAGVWSSVSPSVTLSFSVFAHVLASFGIIYIFFGLLLWELVLFSFPFSFRCLSDVPMAGIWNKVAVLEDQSLRGLVPDLDLQMGFRASSTVTKYKSGWLRWLGYSC